MILAALLLALQQDDAFAEDQRQAWLELATEADRFMVLAQSPHFEVRTFVTENARIQGKVQTLTVTPQDLPVFEKHGEKICDAAEKAVAKYFGELGYHPPKILQDVFGPNPTRRKVILVRSLWGPWAGEVRAVFYDAKDGVPDDIAVSIERPDIFPSDEALVETVTHELFHLVQYGYDWLEDNWIMEATAVAMTDQARPDLAGHPACGIAHFASLWFDHNDLSLDNWTKGEPRRQYGTGLFFEHLVERHGRDIILEIWKTAETQKGSHALDAVDKALAAKGSRLGDAFADFSDAVLFLDFAPAYRSTVGSHDPFNSPIASLETDPPRWPTQDRYVPHDVSVPPLTARYVRYKPAQRPDPQPIAVFAGGTSDSLCSVHIRHKNGWTQGRRWTGRGFFEVRPGDDEIVLVIVNTNRAQAQTAEIAWAYVCPPAVRRVRVLRNGTTVYEAVIVDGQWARKKDEPVRLRKDDKLRVDVRCSARELALNGRPMKRYAEDGWLVELSDLPKVETDLVLEFRGRDPLDGNALSDPKPEVRGAQYLLSGYEPEPDRTHSFRIAPEAEDDRFELKLIGQVRTGRRTIRHDGAILRIVPKPREPYVQADVAVTQDGRARRIEIRGMESLSGTSRGKLVRIRIVAYAPSSTEFHGKEHRVMPPHSDRVWIGSDRNWEAIPEAPFVLGWCNEFNVQDPDDAGGNYVKKGKFRMNGSDGTVEWTGSVTFTELGHDVIAGEFEAPYAIGVGYEDEPEGNGVHGEMKASGRFRVTGERIAWPDPKGPHEPPESDEEKALAARIQDLKKKEEAADPNQDPLGMLQILQERRKLEGQRSELREQNRREYRIRRRNEVRDRCLQGLQTPLTVRG